MRKTKTLIDRFGRMSRWLLAIVREVDRLRHVNARRAEPIRLDWHNDQDPARARGLTVAQFAKSVQHLGARVENLTTLPIGFRARHPLAWLMARLATLPGLGELLTGLVVCVVRKEGDGEGENVYDTP